MLETHARLLLSTLGKDAGEPGIVTLEQLPAAIQALEAAIAQAEASDSDQVCSANDVQAGVWDDAQHNERENTVSLRARYTPVLQMLKAAQQQATHVIWEID